MKKNRKKQGIRLFILYGVAIITLIYSINFLMDKANQQMAATRAKNRISENINYIR